jgi:uncharacterized protein CbrC (UPF0167 family)
MSTSIVLPKFRYHQDPLATGSLEPSTIECVCCGQARGFIYVGPVYCEVELNDALCPWCIADGSAARKFDAEFTDRGGIGDYGRWERVSDAVLDEISTRTPGFSGWQQERWFTCCGDAGVFLGRAGRNELDAAGLDAIRAIQRESGLEGDAWDQYFRALDRDGSPTAYLFRCPECGGIAGYSDCD